MTQSNMEQCNEPIGLSEGSAASEICGGKCLGHVVQILIAPDPSSPMVSKAHVRAVPGQGLEGDRYFLGIGTFSPKPQKPDFEITLIEQENVHAFAADSGLPFTLAQARRNIGTSGVRLNELIGQEFCVGDVRVRGLRLCEPCNHLAKGSVPEVLRGLVHKGGLRAQILSEGQIRVGDTIRAAR
jgi:hypothetical protein